MSDNESEVLEGFLCPTCMKDLKTKDQLFTHVEKQHPEEQDVLQSLKDLVGKAKKKILKLDEHDLDSFKSIIRTRNATSKSYRQYEKQDLGQVTNYTEFYKSVRGTKLEHFAVETNKLLIRLDRLLNFNSSDRRQHEQSVVQWLDGTSVTLCPSCTKSFNITRRQHHCRLCGSVMCQVCSCFLPVSIAKKMTGALVTQTEPQNDTSDDAIRLCVHCLGLLENRHALQERRLAQPPVCELYAQLRSLMSKADPSCVLYNKMCDSLNSGESTYSLADTQTLRSTLAKQAEQIDLVSRRIAALAGTPKEIKLHQSIRRASTIYLKEKLLCLPQLPTQEEIESFRKSPPKTINNENTLTPSNTVAIVTGWSPISQPTTTSDPKNSDPLIVQMDVIRGYIKEARNSLRFEEVALLEGNLRELQNEFHQRQQEKENHMLNNGSSSQ